MRGEVNVKNLVLFFNGIIIGVGKIIPGLSGSMIMMILGLYERAIDAISNYFDDIVENTKFLALIGSGILISIVLISKLIKVALNNHFFLIICFFIGLILGAIPSVLREVKGTYSRKNIIIFALFFLFVTSLSLIDNNNQISLSNENNNFLLLFTIGVIEAGTMIIPGISGTAVLMILGLYHVLLDMFANLSNFKLIIENLKTVIPFLIGLACGGLFFIKLMKYLLTNHKTKTYWVIIAFATSSVCLLFSKTLQNNYPKWEVIGGMILLIFGYLSSRFFDIKFNK